MGSTTLDDHASFVHFLETAAGGINAEQGLALADYAGQVDAGDIVEIGSYKGKSAVALAYGVRHSDLDHKPQVFCIDPHSPFTGQLGGQFGPEDRKDFFVNMIDTEMYKEAALINLPAKDVAPFWTRRIGFLFIDGDHRYHAVREDFMRWLPHVLDGGIVALDDSVHPDLGPKQLINELAEQGFELVDQFQKISFYRKTPDMPCAAAALSWRSVLVVAEKNILTGGLLRFSRMQRALAPYGVKITFAFDDLSGPFQPTNCDVVTMDQALERQWDATILPGAGFSAAFLKALNRFSSDLSGTRVQAVLNDTSLTEKFLQANTHFRPHSVIFNTRAWTPGTYTHFHAERFAVVEGAVDTAHFAPAIGQRAQNDGRFVVGLQAKYMAALAHIIQCVPEDFVFHIIRSDGENAEALGLQHLVDQGRLRFLGWVDETELPAFYHACDCILHLEDFAGWANLVAEAMACGVPVVCSSPGTLALAQDGETAWVVDPTNVHSISDGLIALRNAPEEALRRARAARAHVLDYGWDPYAATFIREAQSDGRKHYLHAPEYGLRGKWPLSSRLIDLDLLLPHAQDADVLDIGCAEGVIARHMLGAGACKVHGFDLDAGRVMTARHLCAGSSQSVFRSGSVADWAAFADRNSDILQEKYDVVLFLAVYQHLPQGSRDVVLDALLDRTSSLFALRTPEDFFVSGDLAKRIAAAGFSEMSVGTIGTGGSAALRLYRRGGA